MVKLIAFYLPQFHVVPVNERIYGKGFTEWDNVRGARPLFEGHHQPHIPHSLLGYYDLSKEKDIVLTHELAYGNGVECFCYYYYNINTIKPLEKPLDIIAGSTCIRNEFCLCWDPGSWFHNRTGDRKFPFLEQVFSVANAVHFIHGIERFIGNRRYIRIDGKPLLLVFAAERCPMIREYTGIWRREAQRMGFPDLCIGGVSAFVEGVPPAHYGFDVMVEFAPNWFSEARISGEEEKPRRMDYLRTVKLMMEKQVPPYDFLRCVFPSWDNTPRKGERGIVFERLDFDIFSLALEAAIAYTRNVLPESLQYVFINAWNEWGEGCHLEPDLKNGFDLLHRVNAAVATSGA
jgi:hypothetical protein